MNTQRSEKPSREKRNIKKSLRDSFFLILFLGAFILIFFAIFRFIPNTGLYALIKFYVIPLVLLLLIIPFVHTAEELLGLIYRLYRH